MIRDVVLALAVLAALSSCRIVAKSDDPADAPQDDAARMAALVETDWEARILPRIRETAAPADEVLGAIAADFAAAKDRHGISSGAEGAPSNFVVRGEGTVVGADLASRAARLQVDLDGDAEADAELQLGPVIRGTALRDSLPFYDFTSFRDQIEFAKLARALNDAAFDGMPEHPSDPVGQRLAFVGVFTMGGSGDGKEIVPLELTWLAP